MRWVSCLLIFFHASFGFTKDSDTAFIKGSWNQFATKDLKHQVRTLKNLSRFDTTKEKQNLLVLPEALKVSLKKSFDVVVRRQAIQLIFDIVGTNEGAIAFKELLEGTIELDFDRVISALWYNQSDRVNTALFHVLRDFDLSPQRRIMVSDTVVSLWSQRDCESPFIEENHYILSFLSSPTEGATANKRLGYALAKVCLGDVKALKNLRNTFPNFPAEVRERLAGFLATFPNKMGRRILGVCSKGDMSGKVRKACFQSLVENGARYSFVKVFSELRYLYPTLTKDEKRFVLSTANEQKERAKYLREFYHLESDPQLKRAISKSLGADR